MKKFTKKDWIFCIVTVVLLAATVTFSVLWAVAFKEAKNDRSYYNKKCDSFALQNKNLSKGQIVFIGDSITDHYLLDDYYSDLSLCTYNRGIIGDTTDGLLSRLDLSLFALEPAKVSLLIGINDIHTGVSEKTILSNYEKILDCIQARLPKTKVFCISVLPMNSDSSVYKFDYERCTKVIPKVNAQIKVLAEAHGYEFVNLYPLFADENNHLIKSYGTDGLHLTPAGYEVWTGVLKPKLAA